VGDGYSYYGTFQGLDFHSDVRVQGMRCSDAVASSAGLSYKVIAGDAGLTARTVECGCTAVETGCD
jgi:hypothetical protein